MYAFITQPIEINKKVFYRWLLEPTLLGSAVFAGNTKPNVLILVTDDQGWGDVGYHGGEMSTPNIDQLVKDGLEITADSHQICSPTRVSS